MPLPPRSPNLNTYAERWVRSIKKECLSRLMLFGEATLHHALAGRPQHGVARWSVEKAVGFSYTLGAVAVASWPSLFPGLPRLDRLRRLHKLVQVP